MKKRLRTFKVKEAFGDPYTGRWWQVGEDVEEEDLLKSGWKPSDVERAIPSLLIVHLLPAELQTKDLSKAQEGGEPAREATDG